MPLIKAGNNSLLSNSFFIFITRFFPSLANLLVMIWYSKHLPVTIYGSYQNFWIQLYVLCAIACFGIHVVVVTYTPGFIISLLQGIKAKQYALYGLWITALASLFAVLQLSSTHLPFALPFLFLVCYSLAILLESVLIVFRDFKCLVAINVMYAAAYTAIHWFVLRNGFSMQTIFICLLVLTALRLCIYGGITLGHFRRHKEPGNDTGYTIAKVKTLWLHLGFYDVTQVLFSYIDKFVISLVLIAPLSAVYYNGSQNIPFLPLLLSAAGSAVLIQFATNKHDEHTDMVAPLNQMGRILSCIVFPVFFFLFFFRQEFIITIFSTQYVQAIPVFMVSILVVPIRAYHFTTVLQRMHKGAVINTGAAGDLLLACGLMYPLYKWLGLTGVALSFVISTYAQATFYLFYTARLLQTSPLKLVPYANWLIKLLVFGTLFIMVRYTCDRYFTGLISLILGSSAMVALVVASLLIEYINQQKYGHR